MQTYLDWNYVRGVAVLGFRPAVCSAVAVERAQAELCAYLGEHRPLKLVIDLSHYAGPPPALTPLLVAARKEMHSGGGDLRLCGATAALLEHYRRVNLKKHFDLRTTLEDCLAGWATSQQELFLQEIRRHPDDIGPRLVFADWLSERGDPLGEFIHVSCSAAEEKHLDRKVALETRGEELLAEHRAEWEGELAKLPFQLPSKQPWEYDRGFIRSATLTAQQFLDHAPGLFAAAPVLTDLKLTSFSDRLEKVARTPYLARVRKLTLHREHHMARTEEAVPSDAVAALASSPNAANLSTLSIEGVNLGGTSFVQLLSGKSLEQLRKLRLKACSITEIPAENPRGTNRPQELDISFNEVGAAGAMRLSQMDCLRELTFLNIIQTSIPMDGISALLSSSRLENLRTFSMGVEPYSLSDILKLADTPAIGRLEQLFVPRMEITDRGVRALLNALSTNIKALSFHWNQIGEEGACAIAASPQLKNLTRLLLNQCQIGCEGVTAILRSPYLGNLESLNLSGNMLSPEIIHELADSPILANLKTLELAANELGDRGAAVLANTPGFEKLHTLNLVSNGLTEEGAIALCESPYLPPNLCLQINFEFLSKRTIAQLPQRFPRMIRF